MKKAKFLIFLLFIVGFTACDEKPKKKKRTLEPVFVETEVIQVGTSMPDRTYVGVVEELSTTSVSFNASGTLTKVYVNEGDHVSAGQQIAEIDSSQARNLLTAAQAQMREADDALERMRQLHESGALPDIKWVETQSKVEQAQAQLDLAKKSLKDCAVRTPVGGIVGKNVKAVGENVLPSMPVASILDISKVMVVVSIPEKEIASITTNTPTTVSVDALGGRVYQGGAITKCVEADDMTHSYHIKICLQNSDYALLPGMVCQVHVNKDKNVSMVSVPISAIKKNSRGEHFVWTARKSRAYRTVVVPGKTSGNRITIEEGLKPGDVIIVEGYQKLSEGVFVAKVKKP